MKRCTVFALVALASIGIAPRAAGAKPTPAARVLVVSFPALSLRSVSADTMPTLSAFLDQAAVAGLATRVDDDHPTGADAYATLAAGTRTRGARTDAGWVFDASEAFGTGTAAEEYTRRTGLAAGSGLVYLAQPALQRANRNLSFGTEIGALGDALERSGHPRAAIANADTVLAQGGVRYERTAATMLTGSAGRVPAGLVSGTLLAPDPRAAYGIQLDIAAVDRAVVATWQSGSVVEVEASDLARAARAQAERADGPTLMRHAQAHSDALFATLLTRVDPARDLVLVVAAHPSDDGSPLGFVGLRGNGVGPGLMSSGTTRRAGFLQLTDIAPTVLDRLDVDIPTSMEGRPAVVHPGHGSSTARRAFIVDADRAAEFRATVIGPVTGVWCGLVGALGLLAIASFAFPRVRAARRMLAPGAVLLLAVPVMTWLAALLNFPSLGAGLFAAWVVGGAVAMTAAAFAVGRTHRLDPILVVLGAIVALTAVDLASGAHLQLNTVFGYSVTIAGRFAGIGNLAYAIFGAAALTFAGLLAHRIGGRRGRIVAAVVLVAVCLLDGLPFFGSDVGGMLSLVPASGIMVWLLWGNRVRIRTVVLTAAITIAVVVVAGFIDLARPAGQRTHLGRLFERIGHDGWHGLWTVLRRKGEANLGIIALSPWALLIPVMFVVVGYFFVRRPGPMRGVLRNLPELRPTYVGLAVLAVLGWFLNDSGIVIPGLVLTVAVAVLVYVAARMEQPDGTVIELTDEAVHV